MSITSEHLVMRIHQHAEALPGVSIRLSEKNIKQLDRDPDVEIKSAGRWAPGVPWWEQERSMWLKGMKDHLGHVHPTRQVHTIFEPEEEEL